MARVNAFLFEMGIVLIISVVGSLQRTAQTYEFRRKILVLLHEICHLPDAAAIDEQTIRATIIKEFSTDLEIVFLNNRDMCTNNLLVLSILMKEMEDQRTIAVIGSTEAFLCDAISKFTDANRKLFISWNCPQVKGEKHRLQSYTVRLLPPVRDVVGTMLSLFRHFRWKRAAIVTVENGAWWVRMASELEFALSSKNISSSNNAFIVLPTTSTELFSERQISQIMTAFNVNISSSRTNSNEVIMLCMSEYSHAYKRMLRVLTKLQPAIPIVVMRLSSNFYEQAYRTRSSPRATYYDYIIDSLQYDDSFDDAIFDERYIHGSCPSAAAAAAAAAAAEDVDLQRKTDNLSVVLSNNSTESTSAADTEASYSPNEGNAVLTNIKYQLLSVSPYVEKYEPEDWFYALLKTSAKIIHDRELYGNMSVTNSTFTNVTEDVNFLVSDVMDSSFRHVLTLRKNKSLCVPAITELYSVEQQLVPNLSKWFQLKLNMKYNASRNDSSSFSDCDSCDENGFYISLDLNLLVLLVVFIAVVFLSGIIFMLRRQYLHRRRLKDPCKILLTSEDIVFPQFSESGKVQEGLQAMLCCWFQELSEFDGPEVDKPDLLKGRDDSVKSFPLKHVNSSNSVTKPIRSTEIKARYNGDLVQLKDISVQAGPFELRSKSLNVLMMIHGLRHENLNPLIGLLADPIRPALVWEYCSRGSLEDVLMQDEIKLDWSFRLSLLTDLVRGMKYLHSCPYRVHGSLTSRNCVIDARWVLKITDYCLAEFNETQNITAVRKSARDLLWTAPELLRDNSLIKKGTQQGDVYSFSIIMQEVVVRGEPFCMLALKPEDIIDKLKTPPPLIRPSVSKGAAPPEAINIMRQCWAEQPDKRPDFNAVYDLFKTLNHGRKINFVDTMFQMLEKYSNNLEDLIRERTEQLDMEKKKTEQLLNRMLPYSVAEKLKLGMHVDPEEFSEVTIYFSDIVGFTTISAYSTPFEVVDLLNDLYTCFDATINAYNVYKVETIGDAYMVVGGLPVRIPDHADQVATMALDLLHQSGQFKIRHLPSSPLRLRIGLHTGSCCAGVVGLTMPRYCLFGDTVNTASRLESTGSPGRIHISEATKLKLDMAGNYKLEYRGETELKGKGKMPTYWLLGKEGFDKDIPVPPPITKNHGLDEELIRLCSNRYRNANLTKHPSESSVEIEPETAVSSGTKQLIVQKSLDSGLPTDACSSSHTHKNWMTKRQLTFDLSDRNYKYVIPFDQKMKQIPETNGKVTKSGSSTPYSTSDRNIDLVGVPFVGSKSSVVTSSIKNCKYIANTGGVENDLSKPYNYYRCLPTPNETNPSSSKFVSKFLKRQFSVDKSDDLALVLQEIPISKSARLFKQNSAGNNHEIEKTDTRSQVYKFSNNNVLASMSASSESLT